MLRIETNRRYIVYPSWLEGQVPCSWRDLPRVLADPLGSPFVDVNSRNYLESNPDVYPPRIQPATCIDGPWGGGVVVVEAAYSDRWLPYMALGQIAQPRGPVLMVSSACRPPVSYLEPVSDMRRGYEFLGWGVRPKMHIPLASVEHADAAGEGVFVVVLSKPAKAPLPGLDEFPDGFLPLGLDLRPLEAPPADLDLDFAGRVARGPGLERDWFEIAGAAEEVGRPFAALLYSAFRLRERAKSRLFSVHLVARVEGRLGFIGGFWPPSENPP